MATPPGLFNRSDEQSDDTSELVLMSRVVRTVVVKHNQEASQRSAGTVQQERT
jgi:hypothetical protein